MPRKTRLNELDRQLRIYDVDQGGWEHEPLGLEFNVAHVLKHLSSTPTSKDLMNPVVIEREVAPDSVQYALRLARWADLDLNKVEPGTEAVRFEAASVAYTLGDAPHHIGALLGGTGILSANLHDLDHPSTHDNSVQQRPFAISFASSLLIYSAELQSEQFGFDLMEAFEERLDSLRDRFDIPKPVTK